MSIDIFTEYDDSIAAEVLRDPLGMQVIWSIPVDLTFRRYPQLYDQFVPSSYDSISPRTEQTSLDRQTEGLLSQQQFFENGACIVSGKPARLLPVRSG